jgi:3-deoxy-manno-octulosonate cytidylyltransferase (CMP-KDO synthetase)
MQINSPISPPKKIIIIPARLDSTRFPEKVLADIAGKPMIQHTYERAIAAGVDRVLIATDSKKVFCVAQGFGAEVFLTSGKHESGTSRIAEVVQELKLNNQDSVLNLQGDEPLISHGNILQVFENIEKYEESSVVTLCEKITDSSEIQNPACVKVVFDQNGYALYFSRAPIPYSRNVQKSHQYFRHIGLYCFRAGFLKTLNQVEPSQLELQEGLEQLSFLYHGHKIHVAEARAKSIAGVDLPSDISRVERFFS